MLSEADRNKAADILIAAGEGTQTSRSTVENLARHHHGGRLRDLHRSRQPQDRRGAKLIGHKVGLTSKAMQRSSQIDEPDYGYLLDHMMIADGASVRHENFCLPRVEVELAFVMGKPLKGPGVGLTDVLRATEYVVPALEIVDARLQDPRKIFDTVSDNGAAAGIVVGGRPVGPMDIDLRCQLADPAMPAECGRCLERYAGAAGWRQHLVAVSLVLSGEVLHARHADHARGDPLGLEDVRGERANVHFGARRDQDQVRSRSL